MSLYKNKQKKLHRIHTLVATHFINKPYPDLIVNHKDGNKFNNNVSNLEWCTYKENSNHAKDLGLDKSIIVHQYTKSNIFIASYKSITEAAIKTGIQISHISECINGLRRSTKGFIWKNS